MKRKKPKRHSKGKPSRKMLLGAVEPSVSDVTEEQPVGSVGEPSAAVRLCLSIWLSTHIFAILVSFTGVVEPSMLHANISSLLNPYLQATHFEADDRPVYLAYGDPSEQPHRLQITTDSVVDIDSADKATWESAGPEPSGGMAVSDRVARWLSTAAMLADEEQPSLVAELLLPIVEKNRSVAAIRILRLTTDLSEINAEPQSPYVARVVRSENGAVSLVRLTPSRLAAPTNTVDPQANRGGSDDD